MRLRIAQFGQRLLGGLGPVRALLQRAADIIMTFLL